MKKNRTYNIHPVVEYGRVTIKEIEEYEILCFPRWIPGWIVLRYANWKYHRYMRELERISEELINNPNRMI